MGFISSIEFCLVSFPLLPIVLGERGDFALPESSSAPSKLLLDFRRVCMRGEAPYFAESPLEGAILADIFGLKRAILFCARKNSDLLYSWCCQYPYENIEYHTKFLVHSFPSILPQLNEVTLLNMLRTGHKIRMHVQ